MSYTAALQTGPISVTEMVIKVRKDRERRENARNARERFLLAEDEKLTEILMNDTPGLRRGRHRATPGESEIYAPEAPKTPDADIPFVRPTSLYELMNMESD